MVLYDLVACDIDGTLLDHDEQLTDVHQQLKQFIKLKKIPFTLVSGRSWPGLKKLIDFFEPELPVLGNNGGTAYYNEKVLWTHSFSAQPLWQAIWTASQLDMLIVYTVGMNEYAYKYNDYLQNQIDRFDRYKTIWTANKTEWSRLNLDKIMIIDPQKPGRIDSVLKAIPINFREKLNIIRYNDRSVDITAAQSDKALGLKDLMEYLGAKSAIACGDDLNDVDFLKAADLGIAVANAHPDLCSVADVLCEKKGAEGILNCLRKIYES